MEIDVLGNDNNSRAIGGSCCCGSVRTTHKVVQVEVIRADVERTFQCFILQGITHVILETAVGSHIILADVDRCFAQLQILRSESEQRLLDIHIIHPLHLQLHVAQSDGARSVELVILLLLGIRQAPRHLHIGIHHPVEFHVLQRINLLNHAQIQRTFSRSLYVRITNRSLNGGRDAERIPRQPETERADRNFRKVGTAARVLHVGMYVDLIHPCRQRRVAEHGIFHIQRRIKLRQCVALQRTFCKSRQGSLAVGFDAFKIFRVDSRNQRENLLEPNLAGLQLQIHLHGRILHSHPTIDSRFDGIQAELTLLERVAAVEQVGIQIHPRGYYRPA